jgi:adenylate cyclase
LALNPNLALAWYGSGLINGFLGRPKTAVEHARHGMRLSPVDPFMFMMQSMQAFAHLVAAEYDEAVSCAEHALRAMPRHLPALRVAAASSALTGRMDQARRATARLLQLDPAFRVSMLKDITPLRRPEDLARYADGLRKAGLPE